MCLRVCATACIFTFIKSFCPSGDSSEKFQTFMKNLEWKLPSVMCTPSPIRYQPLY